MDSLELQLRSSQNVAFNRQDVFNTRLTYPLAMDKKLAQGDAFRTANEKLRRQLQEIDDFYSRPEAPHHTGDRACQRCKENKEKNDKLLQAIAGYYLFDEPEAWTSDFPGYRDSLHAALNKPDVDWNLIHKAFESGIRQHLRNDLCAVQPSDRPTSISSKQIMSAMYSDGTPLPKILKFYISELESRAPTEATAKMIRTLQSTRTAEERARLYIEYYCSSDPSDPPILRNFKQKYARMFEALVPHDEVLKAMRKEVDEVQKSKAEKLQSQLSELQMAQNAHLKNKQKKLDRNGRGHGNAQQMVDCMMEGCVNEVNLMTDEIIECFICEWLAGKGGQNGEGRQRAIYCSAEHAEQDFETHDPLAHGCIMGNQCIHYPAAGAPDSSTSGLCNNCLSHGFISYFCSAECHDHNLDFHRDDFMQRDIGIHNDDDALETFAPAEDMEILELAEHEAERAEHTTGQHDDYDPEELEEGERIDDT